MGPEDENGLNDHKGAAYGMPPAPVKNREQAPQASAFPPLWTRRPDHLGLVSWVNLVHILVG